MADYERYLAPPLSSDTEYTLEQRQENIRALHGLLAPLSRSEFISQHDCREVTIVEYAALLTLYRQRGGQVVTSHEYVLPQSQIEDPEPGTPAPYWLVRRSFNTPLMWHSLRYPLNVVVLNGLTNLSFRPSRADDVDDGDSGFGSVFHFEPIRARLKAITAFEVRSPYPERVESFSDVQQVMAEHSGANTSWAQKVLKAMAEEVRQRQKLPNDSLIRNSV